MACIGVFTRQRLPRSSHARSRREYYGVRHAPRPSASLAPTMAPSRPRMTTLDSDIFKCCQSVKTLGWESDAAASSLLNRACAHVAPIMARRKWSVPVVYEMYPSNPRLLGLNYNQGQWIKIRLRHASSKTRFLSFTSVLKTLLHELAHIVRGPHDSIFYKLLDELIVEAEGLHVPPEGKAVGKGQRLDGAAAVPRGRAGSVAAKAADKRAKGQGLMGSGRLGGGEDGLSKVCSPAEMAGAAAERRRHDDVWCPTGGAGCGGKGKDGNQGNKSGKRARDGESVVVIDLDGDDTEYGEGGKDSGKDKSKVQASDEVILLDGSDDDDDDRGREASRGGHSKPKSSGGGLRSNGGGVIFIE